MVNHIDFGDVINFLREKSYLEGIKNDKGKQANFRKACKNFNLVDGQMF